MFNIVKFFQDNGGLTVAALCVILGLIIIKYVVEDIDWFRNRGEKYYDRVKRIDKLTEGQEQLKEMLRNFEETINQRLDYTDENIENIEEKIHTLIDTDKDTIKAYITEQHSHFMKLGEIDKFSLECLEKLFEHYQEANGNSFVESFMIDLRNLRLI